MGALGLGLDAAAPPPDRSAMSSPSPRAAWPALPYRDWEPTKQTLHRYCQIVGKVRMALVPPRNHWWHVTLYVTATGLSTGPMPYGDRDVEIAFDLLRHRLVVATSDGQERELDLRPAQRAPTCTRSSSRCSATSGWTVAIRPEPFDLGQSPALSEDRAHATYDPEAVERFWWVLGATQRVLFAFCGRFTGKASRSTSSGTRSTSRTPASRAGARRWSTWTR